MLGEEAGRIVRLQSLWNERLASGRDCMLANAVRFERPEARASTEQIGCMSQHLQNV